MTQASRLAEPVEETARKTSAVPAWHLITGEFPPVSGGVGDYTAQLAVALAARGFPVCVWTPQSESTAGGVETRRCGFSPPALRRLGAELDAAPKARTILVQYAPNAFGYRGLNVMFCLWLLVRARLRGDDVRVMFHEPFFYFSWRAPHRNILAIGQRIMAFLLIRASRVVYTSIPAWQPMLRRWAGWRKPEMVWMPVPATIPHCADREAVARIRASRRAGARVVGHFGTYGENIVSGLEPVAVELLRRDPRIVIEFLGKNGEVFVERLMRRVPEFAGRLFAPGFLSWEETSLRLQACDLVILPFPDGASTRRSSLMSVLHNGVPALTTSGPLSEPFWSEDAVVPMVSCGNVDEMVEKALDLIRSPQKLLEVGVRGKNYYMRRLSLEHSIGRLL